MLGWARNSWGALVASHVTISPCAPFNRLFVLQLKSIKKELGLEKDEKTALVQK